MLVTRDPVETGQTGEPALRAVVDRSGGLDVKVTGVGSVVDALAAIPAHVAKRRPLSAARRLVELGDG